MSMSQPFGGGASVYAAPLDVRLAFIRRTYLHLTGAILAFVVLSWLLYQTGISLVILQFVAGTNWLLILGAFMLMGWVARAMARAERSLPVQYAGLALYTVAWTVMFAPMIALAALYTPKALPTAAGLTLLTFGGLSFYVLTTKKDFSFLGPALLIASLVALGVIVCGVLFGWNLGLWFSAAMLLFAAGAVLYSTSAVLHDYRTDQYVAAALELFAAVALLFWYMLRLVMSLQRD